MRISDWSSDVCYSDLLERDLLRREPKITLRRITRIPRQPIRRVDRPELRPQPLHPRPKPRDRPLPADPPRKHRRRHVRRDRQSVVSGTGVSVRVDLGGRRYIKKKKVKRLLNHTPK